MADNRTTPYEYNETAGAGYICVHCGTLVTTLSVKHVCEVGPRALPYMTPSLGLDKPNERVIEKIEDLQTSFNEIALSVAALEKSIKKFVSAYGEKMAEDLDKKIMGEEHETD